MKADARANAVAPHVEGTWLDRLAFWLLAALLCVRPLISESFERASFSFLPEVADDASISATVWLDGLLLVIGAVVWLRRPPRGISIWIMGFLLLLAAVIVSTAAADSKRLALNAGSNLVAAVWAAGALARVLRSRRMIGMLLAALVASGAANAAKCWFQHSEEFEQTLETWLQRKAELAAEGVDVNAPTLVNYERRLRSGQAFGYLAHPNVAAACMNMALLLALGLFGGVWRRPGLDWNQRAAALLPPAGLIVLLVAGILLTESNGAFVAGVIGGIMLVVMGICRAWITKHQRAVFALLLAGYAAVVAGAAGYGWLKGTLPHVSLAFRWQYWTAAAHAVEEHPLTGIGRENFRAAYLRYKPAASTEEVANPHDVWVTLLTELGPLGLCAGAILLIATYRRALRTLDFTAEHSPAPPARSDRLDAGAVALGVLVLQAIFSPLPMTAPGVFLVWCFYFAAVWIAAFVIARISTAQVETGAVGGWIGAGLIAALSATLIHELIEFTLFTPAGAASAAVLAAGALARRDEGGARSRGGLAWRCFVAVGVIALPAAYGVFVAWPSINTQRELTRAKNALRNAGSAAAARAELAQYGANATAEKTCWDATLPHWAAQTAMQFASRKVDPVEERTRWLELAESCVKQAARCVPGSFALEYLGAQIEQDCAMLAGDRGLLIDAEGRWRKRVIPLYPTNPHVRITTGDLEYQLWRDTGDETYAKYAIENYEQALAIDAPRAPEVADKLPADLVQSVRRKLEELRTASAIE